MRKTIATVLAVVLAVGGLCAGASAGAAAFSAPESLDTYAATAGSDETGTVQTATGAKTVTAAYYPGKCADVIEAVNAERAKVGQKPLTYDPALTDAALQRALELTVHYAHTRPDGTSWSTSCDTVNAENIAYGYNCRTTAGEVMEGWMNSDAHRGTLLSDKYSRIGVGCVEIDGTTYWIQLFGI